MCRNETAKEDKKLYKPKATVQASSSASNTVPMPSTKKRLDSIVSIVVHHALEKKKVVVKGNDCFLKFMSAVDWPVKSTDDIFRFAEEKDMFVYYGDACGNIPYADVIIYASKQDHKEYLVDPTSYGKNKHVEVRILHFDKVDEQ